MSFVQKQHEWPALLQLIQPGQVRLVAVHAENQFGHDHLSLFLIRLFEQAFELAQMIVWKHAERGKKTRHPTATHEPACG